jgi:hypothetical protein
MERRRGLVLPEHDSPLELNASILLLQWVGKRFRKG